LIDLFTILLLLLNAGKHFEYMEWNENKAKQTFSVPFPCKLYNTTLINESFFSNGKLGILNTRVKM